MIVKAGLKNRVLEYMPKIELTVIDHKLYWLFPPDSGLFWIGGMYIQSNTVGIASLVSGNRPGIDFRAMDGCGDRDVSEI